jgi:hypothetical protein
MQSLSLSELFSSIPSSSSLPISELVALGVRLFFAFPFDASASAFSTTSSISCVLKTNFPFIATRFHFLRSLRTRNSSLYSAFSFRKRAFSDVVLSKAAPDRSIYRFTGVSRVDERTIKLTSKVACRNSAPSGGELSSRERSTRNLFFFFFFFVYTFSNGGSLGRLFRAVGMKCRRSRLGIGSESFLHACNTALMSPEYCLKEPVGDVIDIFQCQAISAWEHFNCHPVCLDFPEVCQS